MWRKSIDRALALLGDLLRRSGRGSTRIEREKASLLTHQREAEAAETARRRSESFHRQVLESIPGMVFTTRPDGYCDYQSQQWEDYTGVPLGEQLGDGWNRLLHPDDRARAYAAWRAAVEEKAEYNLEYRVRRHDGEYEWFKVIGRPIRDETGHIVRWFGAAMNIEELYRAEEELRAARVVAEQARAEAEQANRTKDEFLAIISHELRTPLTPVLLTVSLLEQRQDLPAEVRADLEAIRRNVQMEARIIDDLLDLTRIARGKLQFDMAPIDLHPLIRSAMGICAHGEGASMVLELEARQHTVVGDGGRLQQVFWNLITNARKFTPHDGTITVRTSDLPDGRISVQVIDTGAGIEPEFLGRVFDAFEQGQAGRARQFGGLGLGLAISRAIMEHHGGVIRAESEGAGRGATFIVELPTTLAHAAAEPAVPLQHIPEPPRRPLSILLVEDHEATLKIMRRLVAGLGHDVQTADSVATARQAAQQGRFDLVISDLGLPDGTGYELMRWLKERYDLKGIALSGHGMEDDLRASEAAGFHEHLIKPVDMQKLEAAIARLADSNPPTATTCRRSP